uniref:Uncharacterized protein n=1 Tax=Ciona intestinalis TaxID=7719 RepID=H2XQH5_CIOIN
FRQICKPILKIIHFKTVQLLVLEKYEIISLFRKVNLRNFLNRNLKIIHFKTVQLLVLGIIKIKIL